MKLQIRKFELEIVDGGETISTFVCVYNKSGLLQVFQQGELMASRDISDKNTIGIIDAAETLIKESI